MTARSTVLSILRRAEKRADRGRGLMQQTRAVTLVNLCNSWLTLEAMRDALKRDGQGCDACDECIVDAFNNEGCHCERLIY